MVSFDQILSYAIPIGVIAFLVSLFYVKFRVIFDTLLGWIKSAFGYMTGKAKGAKDKAAEYELSYSYR